MLIPWRVTPFITGFLGLPPSMPLKLKQLRLSTIISSGDVPGEWMHSHWWGVNDPTTAQNNGGEP